MTSFESKYKIASQSYNYTLTRAKINVENKRLSFIAFSVYSNGQKLFRCKKSSSSEVMECLNGIRVLSIVWVIFGHTHMIFILGPLINPSYMIQVSLMCTFINVEGDL